LFTVISRPSNRLELLRRQVDWYGRHRDEGYMSPG